MKSKRIIIFGMSPMPFENDRKVYGTGVRTWQFALPLLDKGHKLCIVGYAIPSAYPDGFKSIKEKNYRHNGYEFEYHILGKEDFEDVGILTGIAESFEPDCIIGCTFYPS